MEKDERCYYVSKSHDLLKVSTGPGNVQISLFNGMSLDICTNQDGELLLHLRNGNTLDAKKIAANEVVVTYTIRD